jgi:hypothetical protein
MRREEKYTPLVLLGSAVGGSGASMNEEHSTLIVEEELNGHVQVQQVGVVATARTIFPSFCPND